MERAPGMSVPQAINRASSSAVTSARASPSVASVVSATSADSGMGRANVGNREELSKKGGEGLGGWGGWRRLEEVVTGRSNLPGLPQPSKPPQPPPSPRVDREPVCLLAYESMSSDSLIVRGAREHNLKDITVEIPRDSLTVITGLSGSGKSSLAFDTIYAEGQRRYVESLSAYARQFLGLMEKPDVDAIEGLSPAISIEQKSAGHNPRSTVGTITEVYDYLRLLWARLGTPHCPNDGSPIQRQSASQITDLVMAWPEGTKLEVLAPLVRGRKGEFRDVFEAARKQGFVRVRVDGETYDLSQAPKLNRRQNHEIAVVVDRLVVRRADRPRLADSIETALKAADGTVEVVQHRAG